MLDQILSIIVLGEVPGIVLRGTGPLSHIPSPILYFIERQGLSELLSALLLLRLAVNSQSSCLSLLSAGITGTQPPLTFRFVVPTQYKKYKQVLIKEMH